MLIFPPQILLQTTREVKVTRHYHSHHLSQPYITKEVPSMEILFILTPPIFKVSVISLPLATFSSCFVNSKNRFYFILLSYSYMITFYPYLMSKVKGYISKILSLYSLMWASVNFMSYFSGVLSFGSFFYSSLEEESTDKSIIETKAKRPSRTPVYNLIAVNITFFNTFDKFSSKRTDTAIRASLCSPCSIFNLVPYSKAIAIMNVLTI